MDRLEDRTLLTGISVGDITVLRGATGPTVVSGVINPGTGINGYRIDGTAGEFLKFHADSFSSTNGTWFVYGPDNHEIVATAFGTDFSVSLPTDGYYDVYLAGTNGTTNVSYQFEVSDLTDAPIPATGLNAPQSGSLLVAGTSTYSFNAPAGQVIYFDSRSASGITYTLTDPTTQQVFSTNYQTDQGPLTLPHSGTYSLTLTNFSGAVAPYSFNVIGLPSASSSLTPNVTTSGSLPAYGAAAYSFLGVPGQKIAFLGLDTTSTNVVADIYAPTTP